MCDGGSSEERGSQYDYMERSVSQVLGNAGPRWEESEPRRDGGACCCHCLDTDPSGSPEGRRCLLLPSPRHQPIREPWQLADTVRNTGMVGWFSPSEDGANLPPGSAQAPCRDEPPSPAAPTPGTATSSTAPLTGSQ